MKVPGPGQYQHHGSLGKDTPGYSCTPRRVERRVQSLERSPGPGAHKLPSSVGVYGPKHSFTPRRFDEIKPSPGPGEYKHDEARDAARSAKQPRWGFGSAAARGSSEWTPRLKKNENTPGPGSYRHQSSSQGPKFSMRERTKPPMHP